MKACTADVESGEEKKGGAGRNTEEGKGVDNGYVKSEGQNMKLGGDDGTDGC